MIRRIVVVLVAALMLLASLTLVACGGDEPETSDPVLETDAEEVPPAVNDAEEEPEISHVEEVAYEPFPVDPEVGVPDAIQSRLDAGQPMIVLFIDETQKTTDDQVATIDSVIEKYPGLIDVVTFDVGRFVTQNEDGSITVEPEMVEDEVSRQVARMIDEENLDIRFTPYTLIVDGQGYTTWGYSGISDDKTLEREVLRVTE